MTSNHTKSLPGTPFQRPERLLLWRSPTTGVPLTQNAQGQWLVKGLPK